MVKYYGVVQVQYYQLNVIIKEQSRGILRTNSAPK